MAAEEVGVEPTRHRLGISTALKAAHLTGDDSLPMRYLNQFKVNVNLTPGRVWIELA